MNDTKSDLDRTSCATEVKIVSDKKVLVQCPYNT